MQRIRNNSFLLFLLFFSFSQLSVASTNSTFHRFELKTAPITLLARWYSMDASIRINENWTVGPSAILYNGDKIGNMFLPSYRGHALGLNLNYYFTSIVENSWYLGAHSYYEDFTSYPHPGGEYNRDEIQGLRTTAVFGYFLKAWSIVTLHMGAGLQYRHFKVKNFERSNGKQVLEEYNENRGAPYLEFKLGIEI